MATTELLANTERRVTAGRSFFNWTNLGSITAHVAIVNLVWSAVRSITPEADANYIPLALSLFFVVGHALFTEPARADTNFVQRLQKVSQSLVNGIIIYALVIGLPVQEALTGPTG